MDVMPHLAPSFCGLTANSYPFFAKEETILSTLPQSLSHTFSVLTSDNVTMDPDSRISFQIKNVDVFTANPIEYYPYI